MRITPKLFTGLTIAAGLSLVAAGLVYSTGNQWSTGEVSGSALFPLLETRANDIAALEVQQGGKVLKIARTGDGWTVRSAGDYPARTEEVRKVVVRLARAELIEPKTRNPKRYELLDLGDPAGKNTEARRIRLLDKDGGVIAEAVLGRKRWDAFGSGKGGTYVRRPGDPQTWLADLDIDAKPEIKDWVESEIFSLETDKIATLTLSPDSEQPLKIERVEGKESKFQLPDLPADAAHKRKKSGPTAEGVAKAYGRIELEDLRKLESTPGGAGTTVSHLETKDGLKVTFRLRKEKTENWLSLSAEGKGDAARQAERINARVKGWEYKIPSWKADSMFRSWSDFFSTS